MLRCKGQEGGTRAGAAFHQSQNRGVKLACLQCVPPVQYFIAYRSALVGSGADQRR